MELDNKTIIITGAGGGIGAALARRFARCQPEFMLLLDLHPGPLEVLAAELTGVAVAHDTCDVSSAEAIRRQVDRVVGAYGRIDLFCANAGVFVSAGADASAKDWQLSLEVNLMAHVHAAAACLPSMLARGRGYFLHTVSAAGLLSQIGSAPYTVSKHAALAFAEWLAISHGGQGVGVTALCPQGVNTPMLDSLDNVASVASDGLVTPEAVAECALEAIREEHFLALPHPGVAHYFQRKASDHDRWIRGMQKFQASLGGSNSG